MPHLLRVLAGDKDKNVRGYAIEALAMIDQRRRRAQGGAPDARIVAAFEKARKDRDGWVRNQALTGLTVALGPKAIAAIVPTLASKDKWDRVRAASALALLGKQAKPAVAKLLPLLQDKSDEVRQQAVEAVGHIGGPAALGALEVHRLRLLSEWENVRSATWDALERISPVPAASARGKGKGTESEGTAIPRATGRR